MSYVVVALLAGLVGVTEVLSRYRDVPFVVLRQWPAWMYTSLTSRRSSLSPPSGVEEAAKLHRGRTPCDGTYVQAIDVGTHRRGEMH